MTSSPGHIELERSIDSIQVGSRHRTDLGDIDALAASIERHGLLQPITVTPEGVLVCGARRLAALRHLGVRKLNVWVRAGISDRLVQLLAEQDDDALHKPLSPTEAASLYREVKMLLAEDARRRQEASRFGAPRNDRPSDGDATVASPVLSGSTRGQAALMVSGRKSYTTLERIGDLQRIAADDADGALRQRAAAELKFIDEGGSVASAHRRVSAQIAESELEGLPAGATTLYAVREAQSLTTPEAELEELAKDALVRAKNNPRGKSARSENQLASRPVATMPVRSFVFQWNELHEWWLRYDCAEIATQLTDAQWKQFEATIAGTLEFAERLRSYRAGSTLDPQQFRAGVPVR